MDFLISGVCYGKHHHQVQIFTAARQELGLGKTAKSREKQSSSQMPACIMLTHHPPPPPSTLLYPVSLLSGRLSQKSKYKYTLPKDNLFFFCGEGEINLKKLSKSAVRLQV